MKLNKIRRFCEFTMFRPRGFEPHAPSSSVVAAAMTTVQAEAAQHTDEPFGYLDAKVRRRFCLLRATLPGVPTVRSCDSRGPQFLRTFFSPAAFSGLRCMCASPAWAWLANIPVSERTVLSTEKQESKSASKLLVRSDFLLAISSSRWESKM